MPAPYWVYALGPVQNEKYAWAVVSDPLKLTLFVLTRDVAEYNSTFQPVVAAKLDSLGFDGILNSPFPVYQGPGCLYAPLPLP